MRSPVSDNYKEFFDLDSVIKEIKHHLPSFDVKKFIEAFEFAEKYHNGQTRKSGEPYIMHPVETVRNLIKLHVDEETFIAALLHDVPEDTEATIEQINQRFGETVAFLVSGITKLSKVYYKHSMAERQIESLKKLLIHTAADPRVIIIKLADRLHNMRTLEHIEKEEKRIRISKETLEIYVPIANLLGIQEFKSELEDLCFKYLFPEDYKELEEKIYETGGRQKGVLDKMMEIINEALKDHAVNARVYGREKSLYSVYKKISSQHKSISDIHDRLALRVITNDKSDCYTALGIIHDIFNPKPGHFKDYIAVPKVNGYQSIHTTVFGVSGVLTEIQIRTRDMHIEAEYGIAAHYFYDKGKTDKSKLLTDQRTTWMNNVLDLQKSQSGNEDFITDLKFDLFQDRIFVFTPAGETIDLPKHATAIDFAYAIHTEVGNHASKVELNNEIKPITSTLHTGDLVNIVTSNKQLPELYWLSFAKTSNARYRIKLHLKKESEKDKLASGSYMIQKEFDRNGLGLVEDFSFKKFKKIINEKMGINIDTKKHLLTAIGEGDIDPTEIVECVKNSKKDQKDIETVNRIHFKIIGKDRKGLLKDVTSILVQYNLNIVSSHSCVSMLSGQAVLTNCIDFESLSDFSEVCQQIEQVDGVLRVNRLFKSAQFTFKLIALTTILIWATHPFFINAILHLSFLKRFSFLSPFILYVGFFMLFFTIIYLKKIVQKSFPGARDVIWLWRSTFFAATLAVFVMLFELYFFNIHFNWFLVFGGIIVMYAYLAYQYFSMRFEAKS